ncbi:hypothetical protein [Vogesella indigofera]|uniref:hypothetical protein n=1 Tax=Vogesella indigofera TaxID=45465 RepID=UPI00234E0CDD|nr:hypothetical protein [Vogesella indigofera]MDC7704052.1 hypothetical protein [Vogesella indigofera]
MKKKTTHLFAVILMAFFTCTSAAEGFMGIEAGFSLSDILTLYPRANTIEIEAAWLNSHQKLVEVKGEGIPGQLIVSLEDRVEKTKMDYDRLLLKKSNGKLEKTEEWLLRDIPSIIERHKLTPPADPWEVIDIRWTPPHTVPISLAKKRYGIPSRDIVNEQFQRTVEWKKRGITGYLDDQNNINLFVFNFTPADIICQVKLLNKICEDLKKQ